MPCAGPSPCVPLALPRQGLHTCQGAHGAGASSRWAVMHILGGASPSLTPEESGSFGVRPWQVSLDPPSLQGQPLPTLRGRALAGRVLAGRRRPRGTCEGHPEQGQGSVPPREASVGPLGRTWSSGPRRECLTAQVMARGSGGPPRASRPPGAAQAQRSALQRPHPLFCLPEGHGCSRPCCLFRMLPHRGLPVPLRT